MHNFAFHRPASVADAVKAVGAASDGRIIAGARTADGRGLVHATPALLGGAGPQRVMSGMGAGTATTIGVVATDAQLTKTQANKLASLAHHGLSRAIDPLTMNDGDTLFALATGSAGHEGDLTVLGAMAAEAVSRAIRNAVWAAAACASPDLPAAAAFGRG